MPVTIPIHPCKAIVCCHRVAIFQIRVQKMSKYPPISCKNSDFLKKTGETFGGTGFFPYLCIRIPKTSAVRSKNQRIGSLGEWLKPVVC